MWDMCEQYSLFLVLTGCDWIDMLIVSLVISVSEQMNETSGNFTSPRFHLTATSQHTRLHRQMAFELLCCALIYCLVFLHTPMSCGLLSEEQMELHQNSSTSISMFRDIFFCVFFSLSAVRKVSSFCNNTETFTRTRHHHSSSVSVSDLCWALPGCDSSCNLLKYKPIRYKMVSSVVVWLLGVGSCLFSMLSFCQTASVHLHGSSFCSSFSSSPSSCSAV